MYLKDFYFAIKEKTDTNNFEEVVAALKSSRSSHASISKNTLYYLDIFLKNQKKNLFFTRNWAAMLLGGFWFWYRGLHVWFFLESFISLLILVLLSYTLHKVGSERLITAIKPNTIAIAAVVSLFSSMLMGLFANCIYIKTTNRRLETGKSPSFLSKILWLLLGLFI